MGARLKYVDMARGIAICLVVTAHLIQTNLIDGVHNPACQFIMSFFMPLFFAISGYIGQKVGQPIWGGQDYLKFLKKKAIALLLPLLTWELIVRKLFYSSVWTFPSVTDLVTTLTHPGLWFLHTLFRIFVLYGLFQYFSSKYNLKNIILIDLGLLIPILLLSSGMNFQQIHIDNMYLYTIFFYLGVFVSKYQKVNIIFYSKSAFMTSFILFSVFACHWTVNAGLGMNDVFKLVIATCSFVIVMTVCKKYENERMANMLSLWGCYSMEIYVAHWALLRFLQQGVIDGAHVSAFWVLIVAFVVSLPIIYLCIGYSKIVEYSPILRMFLFGRRK